MNPTPGPLADVRREEPNTLVFIRDLRHPPELVWTALTDPEQLAHWAPFEADHPLDEPRDVTLTMIDGDTRAPLPATVRRAEAPRLLEYTWGADTLRWELTPIETGTRLTLRHVVVEQGPEWLAKVAAGWHLCLTVAERRLAGEQVEPIRGQAAKAHGWDDLATAYAEQLDS
jgi:uncharacterized protein YndB with AHSA1/START domain